jgi:hypothetical protein
LTTWQRQEFLCKTSGLSISLPGYVPATWLILFNDNKDSKGIWGTCLCAVTLLFKMLAFFNGNVEVEGIF